MSEAFEQSYYAVLNEDTGEYLGGFDVVAQRPRMVTSPLAAKPFSNKHDVKLRPNEKLVEVTYTLSAENTVVSEPFRPRRREKKVN